MGEGPEETEDDGDGETETNGGTGGRGTPPKDLGPSPTLHPAMPRTGGAPLVRSCPAGLAPGTLCSEAAEGRPRGTHGPRACPADVAAS